MRISLYIYSLYKYSMDIYIYIYYVYLYIERGSIFVCAYIYLYICIYRERRKWKREIDRDKEIVHCFLGAIYDADAIEDWIFLLSSLPILMRYEIIQYHKQLYKHDRYCDQSRWFLKSVCCLGFWITHAAESLSRANLTPKINLTPKCFEDKLWQ